MTIIQRARAGWICGATVKCWLDIIAGFEEPDWKIAKNACHGLIHVGSVSQRGPMIAAEQEQDKSIDLIGSKLPRRHTRHP